MNGADTGAELVALTRWLQKQVSEKRARVVLRQRIQGGENQLVREWRLADIVASDLATAVYERAIEDATQQRGAVQYGLFSYAEGQKNYVDRTFLNVESGPTKEKPSTALATLDTLEDDERAQRAGVVGLLMKHTHASAQLALGSTVDIVRHYKEESERKDARIRELEERQTAVLRMYEELLSAKHERELEMLKAQNSEKRKDHMLEKLDMVIPIAMAKVMPASKTPALGEELASSDAPHPSGSAVVAGTTSDNVSFSEVVRGAGAPLPFPCVMGSMDPSEAAGGAGRATLARR
jgi:hypothetical protein